MVKVINSMKKTVVLFYTDGKETKPRSVVLTPDNKPKDIDGATWALIQKSEKAKALLARYAGLGLTVIEDTTGETPKPKKGKGKNKKDDADAPVFDDLTLDELA